MPRTTPRRWRTPVTLASTTAAVAARIEPPNRASPPMTCPSSIRTSPTISATGTAATSATASSARAITSFDDMFGLRVAYQPAIVPTLPRTPVVVFTICRVTEERNSLLEDWRAPIRAPRFGVDPADVVRDWRDVPLGRLEQYQ